jgi:hypothetical protein
VFSVLNMFCPDLISRIRDAATVGAQLERGEQTGAVSLAESHSMRRFDLDSGGLMLKARGMDGALATNLLIV